MSRTVKIWQPNMPINPDPHAGVDDVSFRWQAMYLEPLLDVGGHNSNLASKFEVDAHGRVVELEIDAEARWSDGQAVVSQDVVHMVERALDPDNGLRAAWQFSIVRGAHSVGQPGAEPLGVRKIDDRRVRIEFDESVPYLEKMMRMPYFSPIRGDHPPQNTLEWAANGPTNGPYRMRVENDNELKFTPSDFYRNRSRIPNREVILRTDIDPVKAFYDGQIDLAPLVNTVPASQWGNEAAFVDIEEATAVVLLLNASEEVFADPKVRSLMRWGIDRNMVSEQSSSASKTLSRMVPRTSGTARYLSNAPMQTPPPRREPILVGTKLEILTGDSQGEMDEASAVADELERVTGANISITQALFPQNFWRIKEGDFQLAMFAWRADYDDPLIFLREHVSDRKSGNQSHWSNAEYNGLVSEARLTVDESKRWELLARAEEIMLAEGYTVPLLQRRRRWVVRQGLQGLNFPAAGLTADYRFVEFI